MVIDDILALNEKEQAALTERGKVFNCTITVSYDGKTHKFDFDDYRVAQAVVNILDNVRFVRKS